MRSDGIQEHDVPADFVGNDEARIEMLRVLSDERFQVTERNKAFLRYVCDELFAGRDAGIKAYTVAVDVFGRPHNFNPSTDPIVRIEATRLRNALDHYYQAFGEIGEVRLHLPKGRYVPVFTRTCHLIADAHGADEQESFDAEMPEPAARSRPWLAPRIWGAALSILALVGAAVSGGFWALQQPVFTAKPFVMVKMQAIDGALQPESDDTLDRLMIALSRFQTLRLTTDTPPPATPAANAYAIDMKYYGDGDGRSVWWQVVDIQSSQMLDTGVETIPTEGDTAQTVQSKLVAVLAQRFATARGVIGTLETHNDLTRNHLGNACLLRAEFALNGMGVERLPDALDCLSRTLKSRPDDPDIMAMLSRSLIASELGHLSPATLDRALDLANAAVSIAPQSDRAYIALMFAQFFNGRQEAAINAGNRALELNPLDPEVSAKLGTVLFLSGFWDAGVALANDASSAAVPVPRDANLVLALDAYRRGDYSEASLRAEQMPGRDFLTVALRAAALGQMGSPDARRMLEGLKLDDPGSAESFREKMVSRRFDPVMTGSIERGLVMAGLPRELPDMADAGR